MIVWGAAVLVLGALAPFADRALSGAGWEAPGSESGQARRAIESHFPGQGTYALSVVVAGERAAIGDRPMRAALAGVPGVLRGDRAVRGVLAPQPGVTVSRDRRTAIVVGLAGAAPSEMVEAAGRLEDRLARLSTPGLTVRLTGPAAMWSDFNHANKAAMMKSEALSWPLTLTLLVLAFGTLVAAGLPLLLTMVGLLGAGGLLFVFGQLVDVSIWAMNFAMMFAIALGIDYALFIVVRFRGALGERPVAARRHGAHDGDRRQGGARERAHRDRRAAGGHARPGPDVPLGAARDRAGRAGGARGDPDAAARRARPRSAAGSTAVGTPAQRRRPLAASASPAGAAGCGRDRCPTAPPPSAILLLLAVPALGLRTGMPTIAVVPQRCRLTRGSRAGGAGVRGGCAEPRCR